MARKKPAPSSAARPWPSDLVERRAVSSLVPYARNARTHSEAQVAQVAASIREFGFTMPVLVGEDGTIIAGHCRVLAAKSIGLSEVPVMTAKGWTEAQRRAYVLADNKLAENAGWDDELLRRELGELRGLDFDLGLLGFDAGEIDAIFAEPGDGLTDPDARPEPPAEPVSVLGDVWLLGRHRIVCGDSTDAATVAKALNGVAPHLMVTDPPYGVEYDPGWRNEAHRMTPLGRKKIGAGALGKVENDGQADWTATWELFPGSVAYVWHGGLHAGVVQDSLGRAGFAVRAQIIWNKRVHIISRGHYHWKHEACWYAVRKGATGQWAGDRKQNTVWEIDHRSSDTGHGTQKPVECMRRPIENNSSPGQAVYEPFSGSGTTIIAAEMTGRACHAIELNPAYVDVAVRRWQEFTGKAATLESDGGTFDEIAASRGVPLRQAAE